MLSLKIKIPFATVSWWLECIYRLHVTDRHIEHQNKIKRPRRLSYEMDTSLTQSYGWPYYHTISFVPNEDHILPRQKCRDGRGYTITIQHTHQTDGYPTRQRRTVQLKNGEEWGVRSATVQQQTVSSIISTYHVCILGTVVYLFRIDEPSVDRKDVSRSIETITWLSIVLITDRHDLRRWTVDGPMLSNVVRTEVGHDHHVR